jgi:hypothetical protein
MKEHVGSYVHVSGIRISACCVGFKRHALFWWILSLRSKPCFRRSTGIRPDAVLFRCMDVFYLRGGECFKWYILCIPYVCNTQYKTSYTLILATSWRMHIEGNLTTRRWRAVLIAVLAFLLVWRKYRKPQLRVVKAQPWQYNHCIGVVEVLVPKCG